MNECFRLLNKKTPDDVFNDTMLYELAGMNRAERRTVKGRLAVAEATIKALEAKIRELENAQK